MSTQTEPPPQVDTELAETEEAQLIAEVNDRTIVATDSRLLIEEDIGVSALDYDEITSVEPMTKSRKLKRFYAGIVLMVLMIPGLIQGSTGALVVFPLGAIITLWGYDRSKVVKIATQTHTEPLRFDFKNPERAANQINSIRQ